MISVELVDAPVVVVNGMFEHSAKFWLPLNTYELIEHPEALEGGTVGLGMVKTEVERSY